MRLVIYKEQVEWVVKDGGNEKRIESTDGGRGLTLLSNPF